MCAYVSVVYIGVNLAGILGDTLGSRRLGWGEKWGSPGRGLYEGARPLSREKIFSLEMVCFDEL